MLVRQGRSAFSTGSRARRLAQIRSSNPSVASVDARFVHLVDTARPLDGGAAEVLDRLLTYGPREEHQPIAAAVVVVRWVVPRFGTRSPWSSKATDIAQVCGLTDVRRIERGVEWRLGGAVTDEAALHAAIHDRMTEVVLSSADDASRLFATDEPRPHRVLPLGADGRAALASYDREMGLALSEDEIAYLVESYAKLGRDPTDVELMMFAQANSEHCRHKIFNATFVIDGEEQARSLFQMIKSTTTERHADVLSAYTDNSAVFAGPRAKRFFPDPSSAAYAAVEEPVHALLKVETHNHPTAISPFPGAATGSGGEIRDEGATGRGAKPKAGLTGFATSNLRIPGLEQPWERDVPRRGGTAASQSGASGPGALGRPARIASPLEIMIDGPLGGAAYNNEFGRPAILGYFRTLELELPPESSTNGEGFAKDAPQRREARGYHKPIMLAGGTGSVRDGHVKKAQIVAGAPLVVLGGPAMLIGLGGGAASSVASGTSSASLDFASVQRDNAEIERRCQEVIDRCWALGDENPILSIHDVGAGGLSNALPELVHESSCGARIDLRKIPSDEPGMTPLELWCNEAQERYVLAVHPDRMERLATIAARERCPFAVVGEATEEHHLTVDSAGARPIDLPLDVVLGKAPRMTRKAERRAAQRAKLDLGGLSVTELGYRLLRLPTIADKTFLVTIGDRTVGGLVSRDPLVGPWQVPVADCAVTTTGLASTTGEAMALGERPPIALLDAAASARMAIGEAVTNIAAARVARLSDLKLSANWMAAAGHTGEDARLYDAVRAASDLCVELGIAIPVGKDSLSMRTVWREGASEERAVVSPVSLVVTALAQVTDVRKTLTPELARCSHPTRLVLIDLGLGERRLGASCLAQVLSQLGDAPPDVSAEDLAAYFRAIQELAAAGELLAYHDRSDGGLFVALVEMAFASGSGLEIDLDGLGGDAVAALFNEELGAVVQVDANDVQTVQRAFTERGLAAAVHDIGRPAAHDRVIVRRGAEVLLDEARADLRRAWSETTHAIQRLRDDPACADEEHSLRCDPTDSGLSATATFSLDEDVAAPFASKGARPRVAILREQGVNGQTEMAFAFTRAGFEAVDVHMTDILEDRVRLDGFRGLAACGGFSYGDVLGAGEGWAKSILYNARAREEFQRFFERKDTFSLGVCNGCQMMSALRDLVPGASAWPRFVRNRSDRFEARLALVEVVPSPSLFFRGMEGSRLPIAVAHGEGRVEPAAAAPESLEQQGMVPLRFVDRRGAPATRYPENPNGSPRGITGVTTPDGRATILMPHPERVFRTVQLSWHPAAWGEDSPWMRMFRNARVWVG